jgi:hypothetical protein
MNKKAILASLFVAASSTAALANPYIVQGEATAQATFAAPTLTVGTVVTPAPQPAPASTVIVRDHRDNDDRRDVDGQYMRDHRKLPVWSVLSQADKLSNGRATIGLGSWRKYSELQLQATKGTLAISRVKVTFANGQSEILTANASLNPGQPGLIINLDGSRQVRSISVFGSSARRAQFEILGA